MFANTRTPFFIPLIDEKIKTKANNIVIIIKIVWVVSIPYISFNPEAISTIPPPKLPESPKTSAITARTSTTVASFPAFLSPNRGIKQLEILRGFFMLQHIQAIQSALTAAIEQGKNDHSCIIRPKAKTAASFPRRKTATG